MSYSFFVFYSILCTQSAVFCTLHPVTCTLYSVLQANNLYIGTMHHAKYFKPNIPGNTQKNINYIYVYMSVYIYIYMFVCLYLCSVIYIIYYILYIYAQSLNPGLTLRCFPKGVFGRSFGGCSGQRCQERRGKPPINPKP
jgi:hypothetical protein